MRAVPKTPAMVLVTLVIGLAWMATAASAATFTVNSTGDAPDASPGAGGCATAGAVCTLRAAIEEANHANNPGLDTIDFSAAFNGTVATSTVTLADSLPSISQGLTINGGSCSDGSGPKPCVGIDGNQNGVFLVNAASVTMLGLAITDASEAGATVGFPIFASSPATGLTIRGSWFGIRLDQSAETNEGGILIQGDGATIGGTTAGQRNVIANSQTSGIDVQGPDNTAITGNYFGTMPDGQTPSSMASTSAIKVNSLSGNTPTGTVIGGADAGSPTTCDSACNVMSAGINLETQGIFGQAGQTQISGNFLGIDRSGSQSLAVSNSGILVGDSDNVTIGGSSAADRNYVIGPPGAITAAVRANSGATGLVVRHNFVGLNAEGSQMLGDGGTIALGAPALNAPVVRDNRVGNTLGTPIAVTANAAVVRGNSTGIGIGGQDVGGGSSAGLSVAGDFNQVGGTGAGEANIVGNSDGGGMLVNGSNNTVVANVIGANAAGTQAHPNAGDGLFVGNGSNNAVGGPTETSGNIISNSGDDAITVQFDGSDENFVGSNRGRNNGDSGNDLFIDLEFPDGPGNNASTGPNEGIQAPAITAVDQNTVSGTGAATNASLQAFVVNKPQGTVKRVVGLTTDADGGNWTLNFTTQLNDGECVQVTQSAFTNNTSELSNERCDADALDPQTQIDTGPTATTSDTTPTFDFSASEDATFECRIYAGTTPSGTFAACGDALADDHGSFTSAPLADGQYTFDVRATDRASRQDMSPAQQTFTVDTTLPPQPDPPATDPGTADTAPPDTTITGGPSGKTKKKSATFAFNGTDASAVASFQCKLDSGSFEPCASPKTYSGLKKGKHTVEVRAVDTAGNVDPTPATRSWTVKKKKRK